MKFSKLWDFNHITSSPHYPQSNGLAERTIQYVKKTLKKAFRDGQDPYLALLATKVSSGPYNNVPPATLMFNRPVRSQIPRVKSNDILTNSKKTDNSRSNTHVNNRKKTDNYSSNAKLSTQVQNKSLVNRKKTDNSRYSLTDHSDLSLNDEVRIHNGKSWKIKGIVVGFSKNPRSYFVRTENGNTLRRNRRHLLLVKSHSTYTSQEDSDDSDDCYSLVDSNEIPITPDQVGHDLVTPTPVAQEHVTQEVPTDLLFNPEQPDSVNLRQSQRPKRPPPQLEDYDLT